MSSGVSLVISASTFRDQWIVNIEMNYSKFNIENISRLAGTVNNEHRKFPLKCIICQVTVNWSLLQLCWSDFVGGADRQYYYHLVKIKH